MKEPSPAARRRFLVVVVAACVAMVPWTVLLGLTLPRHYLANHWGLAWVGLDTGTVVFLGWTAWMAYRRRQALVLSAIITATLLTVDAWFDVVTATGRADQLFSLATAVFGEIPLAVLLFVVASRVLRQAGLRAAGVPTTPPPHGPEARLSHLPLTDAELTAAPPT
jgi:hypothetical protein